MKIEMYEATVGDIAKGFADDAENGAFGYDGKLNIRPQYQREFVYDDKRQKAVINTITSGFPLNVFYWVRNDDGGYELLDGQQRTISFCRYVNNEFSVDNRYFGNLTVPEQRKILDYKLSIYICEGDDREKLDWFMTINIAGEKLTDQEIRNAIYSGPWVTSAKEYFSKRQCAAYRVGGEYMSGAPIHQDYLQTVLKWISGGKENIRDYMSKHQHDVNANELRLYYESVMNWVKAVFPHYRKEMRGIEWGDLYGKYKDYKFDSADIEARVYLLMADSDVQNKKGIYEYVLGGDERCLNLRAFDNNMRVEAYERQQGICPYCAATGNRTVYAIDEMEADHITPWSEGGKTTSDNCRMLCRFHNRQKGAR